MPVTTKHAQPFTEPQIQQLHLLRARGYTLTILWRDEEKLQIVVAGRDPSNARIIGLIDARGVFKGELIDFSPARVGVSAPAEHATIEEVIG